MCADSIPLHKLHYAQLNIVYVVSTASAVNKATDMNEFCKLQFACVIGLFSIVIFMNTTTLQTSFQLIITSNHNI